MENKSKKKIQVGNKSIYRHVLLELGRAEVVVHPVRAGQQVTEVVEADVEGDGHPDGGPQAVPGGGGDEGDGDGGGIGYGGRLYLPPTQSQNSNMFASSMPNLVTSSLLVESATKCLATCAASLAESRNQLLQVVALVIVS